MIALAAFTMRYFAPPAKPAWPIRALAITAAFAVATVIAAFQAFLFEANSCVDAGGVMHGSGHCELVSRADPYVAQLARPAFTYPGLYILWLALLVNAFVPAWAVYHLVVRALRRRKRELT